jgi:hypothetical protein
MVEAWAPGGIEVAQDADRPARVGIRQPVQHLLADDLGLAIGVHAPELRRLGRRRFVGHAVDGGRGGEDERAAVMGVHGAQESRQPADIHVEIVERFLDAFGHGLERGEMHDRVEAAGSEGGIERPGVADIGVDDLEAAAGDPARDGR